MATGLSGRNMGILIPTTTTRHQDANSLGAPSFILSATARASDSSLTLVENSPFAFRIIRAWVVMNAAGAASDTAKLTNAGTDITNTMDVSTLADTDVADFVRITDAQWRVAKGADLKLVTASGARVDCFVEAVRVE